MYQIPVLGKKLFSVKKIILFSVKVLTEVGLE